MLIIYLVAWCPCQCGGASRSQQTARDPRRIHTNTAAQVRLYYSYVWPIVAVKVHTGALTLFLCSRRSFPAVHECTRPASMLRGTHGRPGPADNPHGGPADRLNRSGSTPSRPVSAVVQGQDERITRDPAYRTCSTPCWPCWYAHVRLEVSAGYEGNYSTRKFVCYQYYRCYRYYRYYHYRYYRYYRYYQTHTHTNCLQIVCNPPDAAATIFPNLPPTPRTSLRKSQNLSRASWLGFRYSRIWNETEPMFVRPHTENTLTQW